MPDSRVNVTRRFGIPFSGPFRNFCTRFENPFAGLSGG